jgi:hypothetical protein
VNDSQVLTDMRLSPTPIIIDWPLDCIRPVTVPFGQWCFTRIRGWIFGQPIHDVVSEFYDLLPCVRVARRASRGISPSPLRVASSWHTAATATRMPPATNAPSRRPARPQLFNDELTFVFAPLKLEGRQRFRLVLIRMPETRFVVGDSLKVEIRVNVGGGQAPKPIYGTASCEVPDQRDFAIDFDAPAEVLTISDLRVIVNATWPMKSGLLYLRRFLYSGATAMGHTEPRQPEPLSTQQPEPPPPQRPAPLPPRQPEPDAGPRRRLRLPEEPSGGVSKGGNPA